MHFSSPALPDTARFRRPAPEDGKILHRIATQAGTLEVNSEYAYLLAGLHHADCCVLAELAGNPAGFVSGYWRRDGAREGLFIWQVGVRPEFRRRGLAMAMLLELTSREALAKAAFVETTISPSNTASLALFTALAQTLNTGLVRTGRLESRWFGGPHEAEDIYRIELV